MRAQIGYYRNSYRPIWYNEKKVSEGIAVRLYAGNFIEDTDRLSFDEVKDRFANLEQLNQRSVSKALHVLMNFYEGEELSRERYITIGREYVSLMGLERQPFVIYQHLDAGKPHLHLVVSTITALGRHVKFHRKPGTLSLEAVKQIVKEHGLITYERPEMNRGIMPLERDPEKMVYGKPSAAKHMIEVLSHVLPNYAYTDMNELNAILLTYNIYANTGKPGSLLNEKRGLVYQVHDEAGKFKGSRIPSSKLPSRPGRDWLDNIFASNQTKRTEDLARIRTRITLALMSKPADWPSFSNALVRQRIKVTPFMNDKGLVHEMAFIDHQTRTVVTGKNLGEGFNAGAILEKIGINQSFSINETLQKKRNDLIVDLRLTPADKGRALLHLEKAAMTPKVSELTIEKTIKLKQHELRR